MTSSFFDAGDMQRLDRERELTEQAPRQLPVEDRSPSDEYRSPPELLEIEEEDESTDMDSMLDGLLAALKRRL